MENQTQVVGNNDATNARINARHALIKGAKKTGEVITAYARSLELSFDIALPSGQVIKWFTLTGKDKKGIKEERAAFAAEMAEAGFDTGTIDVYWQRVKKASGYLPKGKVKGSSDTDSKTKNELKTIINRIFKAEENGEECVASDVKGKLIEVYEYLGGEVDNLG